MHAIVVFLVILFSAPSAVPAADGSAHYDSTIRLLQFCSSGYDTDYGYCAGYVTAIADTMLQYELYGLNACPGPAVKSQQLLDNVLTYLKNNPDLHGLPAKEAVAHSLAGRFPCQ